MTQDAPPSRSEVFYSGAVARISRLILVLTAPAIVVAWIWGGWKPALGALAGGLASYESFRSLARGVNALAERVTNAGSSESGKRVVALFVARYVIVAVAAYAIFGVSRIALYGFIGGLCLPVAAMMCEAGYELTMALRHGL